LHKIGKVVDLLIQRVKGWVLKQLAHPGKSSERPIIINPMYDLEYYVENTKATMHCSELLD